MGNLDFKNMSVADFIQWEAEQDERYELVEGEVFAMTGETFAHDRVRNNLVVALDPHLRDTACQVLGPDVKLRIGADSAGYYPDLFVVCRQIDPNATEVNEAKLIIEILSPSTEKKDRGGKWIEYQKLSMLQEYVLIDPDRRRIEIFRREDSANWRLHICSQNEAVRFESLDFSTGFRAIFERLA